MLQTVKRFWDDEAGPELVEWAVVTIILLVAAVVLYVSVGRALGAVICGIQCWLRAMIKDTRNEGLDADACYGNEEYQCESETGG
jgi:Flp pilus assembly pilin Flp